MNPVNSFLSALKSAYDQQGQFGKILFPVLFVLAFCCLCSLLFSLFPRDSPSNALPTPDIFPSPGGGPTPTALFDFDFPTLTPFPTSTFFVPTALPTLTPLPTETPTLAPIPPTITLTPVPTDTATLVPPTATATNLPSVTIVNLNKVEEFVNIQNVSPAEVDLQGWRLLSETGNQTCELRGTLNPNEVLRIWANRGPGFDCRFQDDIWLDDEADPAVLFNSQGQEVSRFP
jgi:hypothetical protein